MYYDINRVLVGEKFGSQKWYSSVKCDLPQKKDSVIVFDVIKKVWVYQLLSSWNAYLVSIGNLKLSTSQKLDSNDNIVNKTNEELLADGVITNAQYKDIQTDSINATFDKNSKEIGVILDGSYVTYDTKQAVTNPFFQYDKDSQFMLSQAKDDSRIPFWRSVANQNVALTNAQMNTLYELLKFTWFTEFEKKSAQIDALGA